MINSVTAKQSIEYSLMDLMNYKTFDKITVSQICNNCGVSRQIFYYYYKDKFNVLNSIYQTNADNIVNSLVNTSSWKYVLDGILVYLTQNKIQYINAFSVEGQNSFPDFLVSYTCNLYKNIIMLRGGEQTLSKSQLFSLEFYCHGAMNMAKQWAKKDMNESPDYMAERLTYNIPIELSRYFT